MPAQSPIYCPKCKTGILSKRVKRNILLKLLLLGLPVKRYKCNKCKQKSYVFGKPRQHAKLEVV